jgi:hypothetical protein
MPFGPRAAYAAARNIVDKIRDAAANTPITIRKLRDGVLSQPDCRSADAP